MAGKIVDITGRRYGRVVIERVIFPHPNSIKGAMCECICDCGNRYTRSRETIMAGKTNTCGCLRKENSARALKARAKHGMEGTKTYSAWRSMKRRCLSKRCKSYPDYGGRGITVCEKWMDFRGFFEDMGIAQEGMTLERKDNNKGYSKENCVWASQKDQANNKRNTTFITHDGITRSLAQWAEFFGIGRKLLWFRLKRGWSFEESIARPGRLYRGNP